MSAEFGYHVSACPRQKGELQWDLAQNASRPVDLIDWNGTFASDLKRKDYAEKRHSRRRHAPRRYRGFVKSSALEIGRGSFDLSVTKRALLLVLRAAIVENNSQAAENRSDKPMKTRRQRWVFLGLLALAFIVLGVLLVAVTDTTVVWSSSNQFCGTARHSMTWASDAYKRGPHYFNQVGVRGSCGQCHIPYDSSRATPVEYVKLLWLKADRGAKDFWNESHKTIATHEEWEKRRPVLRTTFENYLTSHNYLTCRGCHMLDSFAGSSKDFCLTGGSGRRFSGSCQVWRPSCPTCGLRSRRQRCPLLRRRRKG
jgi:nitrate/TMAO reductase-like tetraheme cytochrome c subunit